MHAGSLFSGSSHPCGLSDLRRLVAPESRGPVRDRYQHGDPVSEREIAKGLRDMILKLYQDFISSHNQVIHSANV